MKTAEKFTIYGAQLLYRNFQGKVDAFNKKGDKTVSVLLTDEHAAELVEEGWNVKYRKPREDDPNQYRQPYLPTKINYKFYPPEIYIITSRGKTLLSDKTVGKLDWARIKNVDVTIRPYNYPSINGQPAGISAYIETMFVTLDEDDLHRKYSDIPDADFSDDSTPFEI